jgi:P-type Cu2+ transporter
MAAEAIPAPECCFHCGLPIPLGLRITADVLGAPRGMCCVGCCAVAEMLEAQGLSDWYARRERVPGVQATRLDELFDASALLEESVVQDEFVTRGPGDVSRTSLLIEGVNCGACVWVIERYLAALPGVIDVRVNLETHRAHLEWDRDRLTLRDLVLRFAEIGFAARPDRPGEAAEIEKREDRSSLIRLAVAGLGAMNVMTYSVALYAGEFEGMARGYEGLMRWAGFLVATPVLVISARPFFEAAFRDLRVGRPGMDVPVALAIGGAYLVSALATMTGSGEVYFDSVCMFTFFLSVGRYIEMRVRHRSASLTRDMIDATPLIARREQDGEERVVLARALVVGDRFRVRPGEAVAADGRVLEGRSTVEEALLTGEPWPRSVSAGSSVVAGSINVESPLFVEAIRTGKDTTLSQVVSLIERVQSERPRVARIADRVATIFVTCVIVIATLNLIAWGIIDPDRAIWTTLAVLVATCPCALSLATPAALAAATHGFARGGLLITNSRLFEGLAHAERFIFDKTGTLTQGRASVARVETMPGYDESGALELARCLERDSEHPIARAFFQETPRTKMDVRRIVQGLKVVAGAGIEGTIDGAQYRIGRPEWAVVEHSDRGRSTTGCGRMSAPDDASLMWVLLARENEPVAWFGLLDAVRVDAASALKGLADQGLALEMLSGDSSASALSVADTLGLEVSRVGATPEGKVSRVRQVQEEGEQVVVVGDGVNDAPVLKAGDVSIAMGSGCDLSRLGADAVLMQDDLTLLPQAVAGARRVRRIMNENFGWAIGYNFIALPLAVTGQLPPWLAALGMSMSSLVVVLNALRLGRLREVQ